MRSFDYDFSFQPSAPVAAITLLHPFNDDELTLVGLLDSGSDITMVPAEFVAKLEIPLAGHVKTSGVAGIQRRLPAYSARIRIGDMGVGAKLIVADKQLPQALIGRDVLNHFVVTMDGFALTTTIDQ